MSHFLISIEEIQRCCLWFEFHQIMNTSILSYFLIFIWENAKEVDRQCYCWSGLFRKSFPQKGKPDNSCHRGVSSFGSTRVKSLSTFLCGNFPEWVSIRPPELRETTTTTTTTTTTAASWPTRPSLQEALLLPCTWMGCVSGQGSLNVVRFETSLAKW